MKTITLLALALLLPLGAAANSIAHLDFLGTGPYNYLGTPSFPYYFDDLSTNHNLTLMCVTPDRTITQGETWFANEYSVLQYAQYLNQPNALAEAVEIAWLRQRAGNGSNSAYQGAVWFLDDFATTLTPAAQALVAQVQALGPSLESNLGQFRDITFYVPVSSTFAVANPPQIMVGTPEPATLALLGSGLLTLGFTLRRRQLGLR
jgi:hypothetical protein